MLNKKINRLKEIVRMDYIKLSNNIVWGEGNFIMKYKNDSVIGVIAYLNECKDLRGVSRFSLEDLIYNIGFKPKDGKGKINNQIQKLLGKLQKDGIIECDKDLSKIKINELIKCKIVDIIPKNDKGCDCRYFPLYFKDLDTIMNNNTTGKKATLLKVYCYISARLSRNSSDDNVKIKDTDDFTEKRIESAHFSMEDAIKDLVMTKETFNSAIKELKDLGLINYGTIGVVYKDGHAQNAENVYVLDSYWLDKALECSKKHYRAEGYTLTEKKETKQSVKNKSRKSYLKKKILKGTITEEEKLEYERLGGDLKSVIQLRQSEEDMKEEPTRVVRGNRGIGGQRSINRKNFF